MTGFDIAVLLVLGLGAITGFMRGFVQEALALAAWVLSLVAIHNLHTPLSEALVPYIGTESGAAVLAFAILLLVPYAIVKLLANRMGEASRNSVLGPIDRVLGFGFGSVKGMIIVVMAFSLLVLGYDTIWGAGGRPQATVIWAPGSWRPISRITPEEMTQSPMRLEVTNRTWGDFGGADTSSSVILGLDPRIGGAPRHVRDAGLRPGPPSTVRVRHARSSGQARG